MDRVTVSVPRIAGTTPQHVAAELRAALLLMPSLWPDGDTVTLYGETIALAGDSRVTLSPWLVIEIRSIGPALAALNLAALIDEPGRLETIMLAVNTLHAFWPDCEPAITWKAIAGQDPAWERFAAWARGDGGETTEGPSPNGRRRGPSPTTIASACEASRLYSTGLTEAQIAQRMMVSERTIKRWRRLVRRREETCP